MELPHRELFILGICFLLVYLLSLLWASPVVFKPNSLGTALSDSLLPSVLERPLPWPASHCPLLVAQAGLGAKNRDAAW